MDYSKIYTDIKNIFEAEPQLVLGIVFGSYASQTVNDLSDIDIAVLYSPEGDAATRTQIESRIMTKIEQIISGRRIDFVDISSVYGNPVLFHSIMLEGKVLFTRDEMLAPRLACRAVSEFESTRFLREIGYQTMIRNFTSNGAH